MRTLSVALALAFAAAVWAASHATADAKAEEKEAAEIVVVTIQDLHLTDEQESKIADIRKEYQTKVKEAREKLADLVKEEVKKVREVLTPEQREKLAELKEERKERRAEALAGRMARLKELDLTDAERTKIDDLRKEYRPKVEKVMKNLAGILTDEQKKARTEALKAGKKRREVLASLNLTDDQKEKVTAVCKSVGTLVREEMEKIRDVLTEEQKTKLSDLKDEVKERIRDRRAARIANFKDLNLTDEQKTKIREIRKEYRPKVHEAGNKLRATIREEVEAIVAVIKG